MTAAEDAGYAGTSLPVEDSGAYYAGTTVQPWMLALWCEEPEITVVECVDPFSGNRRRPKLRTVHVPKITGKNVRRFGQNRGRY